MMEDPVEKTRELHKKYDSVRLGEDFQWLANRAKSLQGALEEIENYAIHLIAHRQPPDILLPGEPLKWLDNIASRARVFRIASGRRRDGEEDKCFCGHVRFFHGERMDSGCELCGPNSGLIDHDGHSDEPLCLGFKVQDKDLVEAVVHG